MQKISVPVPPYEKQLWFDELYLNVEEAKQFISQSREEREALLPSVLNQVFNGELQYG